MKNKGQNKRENWIDWAKCIAIYSVVLGHITQPDDPDIIQWFTKLGYAFQLPVFFFLSGYLFKVKSSDIFSFIKDSAISLLIPYAFYNIISAIPLYKLQASDVWHRGLNEFLLGESYSFAGPCWFLFALFFIRIFAFYWNRIKVGILILFFSVLFFVIIFCNRRFYYSLDSAIISIPFFMLGYYTKKYGAVSKYINYTCKTKLTCMFLSFLSVFLLVYNKMIGINIAECMFRGDLFTCYLGAFLSIFMLFSICVLLNNYSNKYIMNISKGCITIMGLHMTVLQCLWPFQSKIPDWGTFLLESPFVTPLVFMLTYFVAIFLMRKAPLLVGCRI